MQDDNGALALDRTHRVLKAHRFAYGLGHQGLDHGFAERSQHAAAESTDEAFYSDEGNAVYLVCRLLLEKKNGAFQDVLDVLHPVGLVIMISEYADNRDGACAQ